MPICCVLHRHTVPEYDAGFLSPPCEAFGVRHDARGLHSRSGIDERNDLDRTASSSRRSLIGDETKELRGQRGSGFRCHAWRALHPPHELVHLLTACSPSSASPGSAPALRSSPARGGGRGGGGGSVRDGRERERERERKCICALAHVHSVLEVEVPVGQGDEANGTHAQYLRRSEAHDQVHATTSQPRAPALLASPRQSLGDLGSSTQLVCVKKL